jgi:hypothetical protein
MPRHMDSTIAYKKSNRKNLTKLKSSRDGLIVNYGKNIIGVGTRMYEPVNLSVFSPVRAEPIEYNEIDSGKKSLIRSGSILSCDLPPIDGFSACQNILIGESAVIDVHVGVRAMTPEMVRS